MVSQATLPRETILAHLEAMLADRRFASAERNTRFLRYVVERTLEGRAEEIKETVIASEVYGRAANYDPKTDSIVRVEATRLRQKMRSYYENEGRDSTLRIVLPSGTYVPRFEPVVTESAPPRPAVHETEEVIHSRPRSLAWAAAATAAAVLLSVPAMYPPTGNAAPPSEAIAAWQEGVSLLAQDPHTSQVERGTPPTLVRAIERLEFAVSSDPKLAPAWATLAEAYDYVFPYAGRNAISDSRRAETAARRAVALDDKLSAGHHMLGLIQWLMKWDFTAAETSYRRALQLDPRNVYAAVEYADLLRETGRLHEALDLVRQSRKLLPALPQLAAKQAEIEMDLGRVDAAVSSANAALQMNRTYLRAYMTLAAAEELGGNADAALKHYEHVLMIDPSDRRALPAYGYLLARTGRRADAVAIAGKLERMNADVRNCAFQVAVVYAGLGDTERALDWLETAWRTRQMHLPFAAVEARFADLHAHPRFRQLLSRIGLRPVRMPGEYRLSSEARDQRYTMRNGSHDPSSSD